ncbi:MAG: DUF4442 domain-containing protein [FCB group bacterium]|nr:DUF4442 domain-containing protein [FCB group bacterium]
MKPDWKATRLVWVIGLWRIPLIWYVRPTVLELNENTCRLRIRLRRRTKNHLGSMYLGALAVGADLAGGLIALHLTRSQSLSVKLVFKDFHADFLKRAEGDVVFTSDDGPAIQKAMDEVIRTEERVTLPVMVTATVPDLYGEEPVATFRLGLSLK